VEKTADIELNERQRAILRGVVEEYVATRQPVGSRTVVEQTRLSVSASTVRTELAVLERLGLLTHPHTSAGRVPTERGYRYYADRLLERLEPQPGGFPLDLTTARTEVDVALQATTEMLSELTRLLALVSAPPLGAATVRHVEVLLLQAQVVMVVVITSTGSVTKRVYRFAEPVDPGLASWAAQYLNERVAGLELGSHALRRRLDEPTFGPREATFLAVLRPLFDDARPTLEQRVPGPFTDPAVGIAIEHGDPPGLGGRPHGRVRIAHHRVAVAVAVEVGGETGFTPFGRGLGGLTAQVQRSNQDHRQRDQRGTNCACSSWTPVAPLPGRRSPFAPNYLRARWPVASPSEET